MQPVPGEGPTTAAILLLGEAPGSHEAQQRRPFVGPAGMLLDEWLRGVGLDRRQLRIDNIYPFQPPGNKIEVVPAAELASWAAHTHTAIAEMPRVQLIVPMGNTALQALTSRHGITRWRGSVLAYQDRHGRQIKVIPTLHPAAVLRQWTWNVKSRHDWRRIADDAQFPELRLPDREHLIRPTLEDIANFYYAAEREPDAPLALDIETPGGRIVCVGLALSPSLSLTVPTTTEYWRSTAMVDHAWGWLRAMLALPNPKITHNGFYDYYWLADQDIVPVNWRYDTMAMHHALNPAGEHKLAYLASIDTRQPYWKGMTKDAKDDDEYSARVGLETLWAYNGVDACVTRELASVYLDRLTATGRLPFYEQHYQAMLLPLLDIMRTGVRIDDRARRRRHLRLVADCITIQDQLAVLAGGPLHAKSDLSNAKVAQFLYGYVPARTCVHCKKSLDRTTAECVKPACGQARHVFRKGQCQVCPARSLGLPRRVSRQTGGVTVNELAIRSLILRYPDRIGEAGALILEHKHKHKLSTFLQDRRVDPDDRIRCAYKMTTVTGRLASSKNPKGGGANLQNQSREIRDIFVPDPGHVLVEVDESQAEWRIVCALTRDLELIALANRQPHEFDIHRYNGSIVFRCAQDDITKERRYLAKRAVHATSYGMMGLKLSEVLLNDGVVRTPDECQVMIDTYLERFPPIREWQRQVRAALMDGGRLVSPFGRVFDVSDERLDDELYRQGYAFVPQSTCADILNQYGLVPVYRWLRDRSMQSRIVLQVHDALVLSCPPHEAYDVARFLRDSMERPINYDGIELTVPVEVKVGRSWQGEIEYKSLPDRLAFERDLDRMLGASVG